MNDLIGIKSNSRAAALNFKIQIFHDEVEIGYLVPVGLWALDDSEIIQKLTDWRNASKNMFLTQFTATLSGTANFLENQVILDPRRILFLAYDLQNNFVGHIGFANLNASSCELDNLIIGLAPLHKFYVPEMERALIRWIFKFTSVNYIYGRVFSHNFSALMLHLSLGFEVEKKLWLSRVEENNKINFLVVDRKNSNTSITLEVIILDRNKY